MVKKSLIVLGVIIVAFVAYNFYMFAKTESAVKALVIEDVDIEDVKDGTYEGVVKALLVTVMLNATVADGKLTGIDIVQHGHGPNHSGEPRVKRILDAQSVVKVDALTGATGSGIVVRKAVELALKKGLGRKAELAAQEQAGQDTTEEKAEE
jgi:uncharacterized protein with FMN-binding domain